MLPEEETAHMPFADIVGIEIVHTKKVANEILAAGYRLLGIYPAVFEAKLENSSPYAARGVDFVLGRTADVAPFTRPPKTEGDGLGLST